MDMSVQKWAESLCFIDKFWDCPGPSHSHFFSRRHVQKQRLNSMFCGFLAVGPIPDWGRHGRFFLLPCGVSVSLGGSVVRVMNFLDLLF